MSLPAPPARIRAIAVGIPDRLRSAVRELSGVLVEDNLANAADIVDMNPGVSVIYGEGLFGAVVTGQPIMFLPEQKPAPGDRFGPVPGVIVLIDHSPFKLDELEWDDPRRLATQAGVRVLASHLVDVSQQGVWVHLDVLLDQVLDTPRQRG